MILKHCFIVFVSVKITTINLVVHVLFTNVLRTKLNENVNEPEANLF
jgi:hypothetical protein